MSYFNLNIKPAKYLAVIFLGFVLSGCATIIRGTTEDLQINSDPQEAKATISQGMSCTTPCSLELKRNSSYNVKFEKDGCEPASIGVFPSLAGSGVLLGGIIDYGTGAVYDLQPNPVVAQLACGPGSKSVSSNDRSILNVQLNMGESKEQLKATGIKPVESWCIRQKEEEGYSFELWDFATDTCQSTLIKNYALIFRDGKLVQIRKINNIDDLSL